MSTRCAPASVRRCPRPCRGTRSRSASRRRILTSSSSTPTRSSRGSRSWATSSSPWSRRSRRCRSRSSRPPGARAHWRRWPIAAAAPDGAATRRRRDSATSRHEASMRPRVVIAGAGFGGLTCARGLKRAPVDVLLVDRNNYHLFTPLLYQVASALLDPGEIARPVRQLIRPLRNADFRQAFITGLNLDARQLLTDHGPIGYDYLVLASGAQSDYFGNESLAERTLGLKDLDEGLAIRNHILSQFEASRWTTDASERRRLRSEERRV